MATFGLDAEGALIAGQGVGNLFKALATGDLVQNQAKQTQQDRLAQMFLREQQGRKAGAEAKGLELTNSARTAPLDASFPERLQLAQKLFAMTGDNNMLNFAKAGGELQTQDIRDRALQNVGNADMMNRLNTLTRDGATYEPFSSVNSAGLSTNKATGGSFVSAPTIAKLYGDKANSSIELNNARTEQALSSASRAEFQNERDQANTQLMAERLNFLLDNGRLPGTGSNGESATNAKTRNAVIAQIERDMPGLTDDEFEQELAIRMERRRIDLPPVQSANKNPAAGSDSAKIEAQLPKGSVQIGTSGGKPVYQTPDGKKYIME